MPRLNSKNECTIGYHVSWYDDARMILQSADGRIVLSDGSEIDKRGDTARIYANGNGVWAAFRVNAAHPAEVFGRDWSFMGAGMNLRMDDPIGPDGSMAYKIAYYSFGPWKIRNADGSAGPTFGGDCATVQNLGGGKVMWTENWVVKSNFGSPFDGIKATSIRFKNGHLLWQSQITGELMFDRAVIAPAADYFRPDFNMLDATHAYIVWAAGQGETAADIRKLTLDLTAAPDVPVNPPISNMPTIQAYERKLWIAPFYSHSERYGDTPTADHCGNAVIVVEEGDGGAAMEKVLARVKAAGFPIIADANHNLTAAYADQTVAWWAGNAAVAKAALNKLEKPVIWYEDVDNASGWPTVHPDWATTRVWPAVQTYRKPGEALAAFEARVTEMFTRVASYGLPMVMVPRFDDFNGTGTVAQTLEAMPIYRKLLDLFQIIGFLPFADRRGNGISSNADLKSWAMAFKLANPARPNRYDYWIPSNGDLKSVLKNKFGQSTSLISLTKEEKEYIVDALALVQGQPPVPAPQPVPDPPTSNVIPDCKDILDAVWASHPTEVQRLLAASDAYEAAAAAHGASSPEAKALEAPISEAKGAICDLFATACAQRDPRLGQRKKTSGTRHKRSDGVEVATDIIMWRSDEKGNIIDTLSDRSYGWFNNPDDHQPIDQWVAALPQN